jgi:cell division protein FtsW
MWIERDLRFDLWLLLAVLSLTGIGIVMIYSTSSIPAEHLFGAKSTYFLKKQLLSALVGIAAMALAMHLNYERLEVLVWPLLVVSIVMLVLVLAPGIGTEVKGSRRWLRLAGQGFQPSELARLALVLYLAYSLTRKQERIKSFLYGFLPYLMVSGLMLVLILIEPDMGGAVTLGLIMLVMLFVAGTRLSYLLGLIAVSIPVTFYFMASAEYRWRRVMATINPWDYWHDAGWQLVQSLLAFGSGGLLGAGLGEGRQKLFYLPDAHTDFILSVIGEELGFVGVMAVLLLFGMVAARGGLIALRASTPFGSLLAFGLTTMIALPALINMMVVMGLLPTKGLVLPFISYGGSALVIYLAAAGILLNVSAKMYRTR